MRSFFITLYIILAVIAFPISIWYSDSSFTAYEKEKDEIHTNLLKENNDKILNLVKSIEFDIPDKYKASVINTLQLFPYKNFKSLQRIKYKPDSLRRGMASDRSIYLNFDKMDSDLEIRKVLIHEIWHIFDLWYLTSKEKKIITNFKDWSNDIYADDISLTFYSLCWKNEYEQNGNCKDTDFSSWYSQSDAFEDFAESYLLYIEHNWSFQKMMKESDIMKKKYILMRKFLKVTPKTWEYKEYKDGERVWDLTVTKDA